MAHSLIWIIEDEASLPSIYPHIREFSDTTNHIISLASATLNLVSNDDEAYEVPIRLLRHILQHDTSELPLKNIVKFTDFVIRESASTIIVGHIGSRHAKQCVYELLANSSTNCLYLEGNLHNHHQPGYYGPAWQFLYTAKSNILANMSSNPHNEHHLFTYSKTHLPNDSQCITTMTKTSYFKYITYIYALNPEKIEEIDWSGVAHHCYICFFDPSCHIDSITGAIKQAEQRQITNLRFILSSEQSEALKPTILYPYIYILNTNLLYYLHSCNQLLLMGEEVTSLQIHHSKDPIQHQGQYLVQEVGYHITWRDVGTLSP